MLQKEFDFSQPAFIADEIRRIPGTFSGITEDGRVWNYRKSDWHRITIDVYGNKRVGIYYIEDSKTKTRGVAGLLKDVWGIDIQRKKSRSVPVYVVETGEVFPSQAACGEALGFSRKYVNIAVKTGRGIGGQTGTIYHIRRVEDGKAEE